MMTLAQPSHNIERNPRSDVERELDLLRTIVAREGTALAAALRAGGCHARAGWRSSDTDGVTVWKIRFEHPDERVC